MSIVLDRSTQHTDLASPQETAAILVERAKGLTGLIKANADKTEQDRRVPDEVIDALSEAGLFKLGIPRRLGGYELPFRQFLEVTSTIAQGDGSTAWVVTLTNVCGWLLGVYPDQAQHDVFDSNPDARICGVVAPTATAEWADGGLRITGKWGFASGSAHADWAMVGMPVVDETGAQVDQGMALIPMSHLSIEDTWYVAGMQGSASNTLVAQDVFVPTHRILSVSRAIEGDYPTEHKDEALYRSAFVPVLSLVLAGPLAGLAQASLDLVTASLAKGKGISYTFYEHAIDAGSTQINIAEAATLVDTCFLHLYRSADAIDQAAAADVYPSPSERARVRMDTGYVARKSREAIDILLSVQGAGSFAKVNALQRMWRDANTASRHAVINPSISSEAYGRTLLGIKEQITPLI